LTERRRSPHRVIARLATRLAQCEPHNADERIADGLATVGRTCGADRCVIFSIDLDDQTFSQSHRWCRPGVEDIQLQMQRQPMNGLGDLVNAADRSGTVFVLADDIPADSALGGYLARADAWAVAYAPLRSDDGVTGVLGLTWQQPTRRWGSDSSVVLQSAAQVIGRTLSRTRSAHADAAYRDKLRALTARLDQLDAVVRRETAADLHDGAAQSLAVARLRLAQIRQHGDASSANLQAVEDMIVAALTEIRGVIRRMVPSALYDLGLAHALREFVAESREQLDNDMTLVCEEPVDPLPAELASLLYRSARELLTNAIKHAEATRIVLRLTRTETDIAMEVEDDGRGFKSRRTGQRFADGTGLGLFGLRERLARVGGAIAVHSDSGGTRITVTAPLVASPDADALAAETRPAGRA
ncbi:MAG: ATP-binding protein, partial [Pseudomonadota bacterium]